MILVDTSIWIDLFAGRDSPHVKALELLVANREDLCICGVILTEVLQGIKNDREYNQTNSILSNLIFLPMTRDTFVLAANIYRTLRARGITIRNSIDCMIAAVCIEHGVRLLHNDRDFDLIVPQSNLKIVNITEI